MKKRNVKAFTVVELVIVIAVIAVLAAVMIPTFSGLIKMANISADEAELASLNTNLAVAKREKNGAPMTSADVYRVIEETYGAEKAATFAPRSADKGYFYWYDIIENKVILATNEKIEAEDLKKDEDFGVTEKTDGQGGIMFLGAIEQLVEPGTSDFIVSDSRSQVRMSFSQYYFILDKGGSIIGDALKAIEEGAADVAEKLDALKEDNIPILAAEELKDMAGALLQKVQEYVYISNDTIFVANADSASDVIFTSGITTIPTKSESLNYIAKAENLSEITLPSTVTSVEEGSLWFDVENTVKIKTEFTKEQIIDIFKANSTNAIIIDKDGNEYIVDGASLKDGNAIVGSLEYSNKVTSFEIVCPSGEGFDYQGSSNEKILYVAHNKSSFTLTTANFETEGNGSLEKGVKWSAEGAVSVDGNGKVTLNVPEKFEGDSSAYVGKVTATSVTNGEAKVELEIRVVTMMSAVISVGTNQLSLDNTSIGNALTLTYDGTPATAEYAISGFASTYNYTVDVKCCTSVTPTFTLGSGNLFTIDENNKLKLNTQAGNLNGTQIFTVKVGNHIEKTFTVTVVDNSATDFEKVFENTDKYLYRIGNANTVTLGQLFKTEKAGNNGVTVAIYDASVGESKTIDELVSNQLKATYTKSLTADNWAASTIKFSGTGVAIIKITNKNGTQTLIVEVVDGYNITDGSQLKTNANNVLLNDVARTTKFSLTGDANNHKVIYGNGFTLDITGAPTTGNSIITLSNADLDNVSIVGQVYETYQDIEGQGKNEWYASAVEISSGSARIINSYIFGCRANIRTKGNLEIVDSVLECARLANVDVMGGTLTIDGLTTINEPTASNKNVVGLGIMINTNAVAGTEIKVKGELTQYNWIRESDENYLPNMTGMSTLVDNIFKQTKYLHTVDGVQYANMGIACLNGDIPTSAVSGYVDPYEATELSLLGFSGFVVSPTDAKYNATAADLVYRNNEYNWEATAQGNTTPKITWGQYNADITFERGQSFEFDPNVLTATKHGNTLTPTVTFNDVDYTGKKITFTEDGKYTIKYTVKDSYVYDASGNAVAAVEYEYYIVVNVITTNPAQKAPEFSFTGATGFTTVEYNGKTYVVPTGNTSDTSKFYNVGNGIYAPIVTVQIKDNTSDFTGYYPIFGGISITWYDEAGNATTYNSSSNLSAMPEGLTWITEVASLKGAVSDWSGYTKYSGSGLCRQSAADGSTNNSDTYKNVEFSFEVEGVGKYYYYIRFKEPAHTCPSGCVTGDTLVTLADGTQVRVDSLTGNELLRVWDHTTGTITVAPIAYIVNHDETISEHDVLKMAFSDGNYLEIIGEHVFYDKTLNKYVAITAENVNEYIGHVFVYNEGNSLKEVTLVGAENLVRNTGVYEVVTYKTITCFTNGILSASAYLDPLLNVFDMDADTMVYDEAQMLEDIATYGLYTYEDFAGLVPEEAFDMYNAAYLKIAVGKGYITWDDILELIDIYYNNNVTPLQ